MVLTVACAVGSAVLVATTTTACELDTAGALKSPLSEIVPMLADHRTPVSRVSSTKAVNCRLPPEGTLELPGDNAMRAAGFPLELAGAIDCMVLLQAVMPRTVASKSATAMA